MEYDTANRRITKTVDANGAVAGGEETTYFIYDREHVTLDFVDADGSGSLNQPAFAAHFVYGNVVDQVLARDDASGASADVQWFLTDQLGSVRDVVDNSGVVRNHIVYDTFGNVTSQTDAAFASRYLFTGREFDEEIGLYYYRARFYDSHTGRFISKDPLRLRAGDPNFYRYVGNAATMYIDPSGLTACGPQDPNRLPREVGSGFNASKLNPDDPDLPDDYTDGSDPVIITGLDLKTMNNSSNNRSSGGAGGFGGQDSLNSGFTKADWKSPLSM